MGRLNCFAASPNHTHNKNCFAVVASQSSVDTRLWGCCGMFCKVEKAGIIVATETGYSVTCQCDEEFSGVLMDLVYCPFCAAVLPTVNKSGDEW